MQAVLLVVSKPSVIPESNDQFALDEVEALERKFRNLWLLLIAVVIVAISGAVLALHLPPGKWQVLICMATGLAGSTITALISALNRRANGFEDSHGNQFPEPDLAKERFNFGMYYWLITRPILGLITGGLAYWGATGDFFGNRFLANSAEGWAFIGLLAGLFAKTLLEIVQNGMKGVFGLK